MTDKTPTILVVDNTADSLEMIAVLLTGAGFSVACTSSPFEGMALYNQAKSLETPFDLLLLDAAMPEMSGFQMAKMVRLADMESKIVILTAYAFDAEGQQRARQEGVERVLRKPEDVASLPEILKEIIGI